MKSIESYFLDVIHKVDEGKYQWLIESLKEREVQVNRIANFGCNDGSETLILMYLLAASEGVGIDKDTNDISNAQRTLEVIQSLIWRDWIKGVPEHAPLFLRASYNSHITQFVKFYKADIAARTPLLSDYYDIAFCDFVLHHIWMGQDGEAKTQEAINEMTRVVKPNGFVAIRELTEYIDITPVNIYFKPLLEKSGLKIVLEKPNKTFNSERGRHPYKFMQYLCIKEYQHPINPI